MKMKIIDLFSGAGGLTEGFRNKGFEIVGHVEKEQAASKTLQLRDVYYYLRSINDMSKYYSFLKQEISLVSLFDMVPNSILQETINEEINANTLENIFSKFDSMIKGDKVSGVIGGPPCQAYSTIGRARNAAKKGTDDRIYLYRYYIDFLKKYKPNFFVFENVKGLLSFKDIDGQLLFPKMQNEFRKAGFELDYRLVNTANYGVPQNRERIIIFGTPNSKKNKIKLFFEELSRRKTDTVNLRMIFEDMPSLHAGETVNYYAGTANAYIRKYYRQDENIVLTQNTARPNTLHDLSIYKKVVKKKMEGKNFRYDELPDWERTHKHADKFLDRYKALSWDAPSHTIVAHISKDGHHYIHPDLKQNRSITVREAARIQGFPDDFYFETSRTSAFLQIGNAVPPILSEKIAGSIDILYNE